MRPRSATRGIRSPSSRSPRSRRARAAAVRTALARRRLAPGGDHDREDRERGEQEHLHELHLERPGQVLDACRRHRRRPGCGEHAERQEPVPRVEPDGHRERRREQQSRTRRWPRRGRRSSRRGTDSRAGTGPCESDPVLVVLRPEVAEPEVAAKAALDEGKLGPEVGERHGRVAVDHDAKAERRLRPRERPRTRRRTQAARSGRSGGVSAATLS